MQVLLTKFFDHFIVLAGSKQETSIFEMNDKSEDHSEVDY